MSTSVAWGIVSSFGLKEGEIRKEWTGDYDKMVEYRTVRVLVPYSKTFYFLDRGKQRGLTYEMLKQFEKFINTKEKTKTLKIKVVVVPTPRNQLISGLESGLGDIAAGNLTVTDRRSKVVDFSDPFAKGVNEIIAAGKSEPPLKNLFDLAGRKVFTRKSSSYYESLLKVNKGLQEMGKSPVEIITVDEHLEDEDLLEMMNAGVVPLVVIDNHKGEFWAKIFKNIVLYPEIKVNTGGEIGWAFRKNSPKLKAVINEFVKKNKQGTLMGNILINRYLKDTKYITNNLSDKEIAKFNDVIGIFQKYADKYNFDFLMLGALAYQESQLDNSKRSHAGAVGIMQVLPKTAADRNVGIPHIEQLENNVHAGTKYLRFMVDRYFASEKMDDLNKGLFAFAAYNAGPARVDKLRREAANKGLAPNQWFNNVEVVAAHRIGRETVQYVSNIYKYYIAYKIIVSKMELKKIKKSLIKDHYQ